MEKLACTLVNIVNYSKYPSMVFDSLSCMVVISDNTERPALIQKPIHFSEPKLLTRVLFGPSFKNQTTLALFNPTYL